ncbi:MAG: hypothetical protein K0S47_1230 [Herbinix sp.]|jgi:hypothetical protein|nr:hypothetical protein [Herbinix sp.]
MYLLPSPQQVEWKDGNITLTYQDRIVIDQDCTGEVYHFASILKQEIQEQLGFAISIAKGARQKRGIYLKLDKTLRDEEYSLVITTEGIVITGGDEAAILYGIQTLRQIITQSGAVLPYVVIKDYPEMKNRGYYFDVTRGRVPTLAYLKAFADKLSFYKINQLQLYVEHSYLFQELSEMWRDDTPLTADEILEFDAYCKSLHIELVPSMASFGHLYKLLSTKSFSQLCEMEDSEKQPFSFDDRMAHHTIDVSNDQSLILIKKMIDEYLPLFHSKHFNICADETFDLGKGKAKVLADSQGIKTIYIDFVKELCEHLIQKGKRPMFWGDVVCGFPEAIQQLPKETICLNWGYAAYQSEESTKLLHQAGATQYLCPGVGGWNQYINMIRNSYENITRMCTYAHQYQALGVLNTDWGDYGHINHPEFSTAGMIYGAAFSWNKELIGFEDINRQISRLEYGDKTEQWLEHVAALATNSVFEWFHTVRFMEMSVKGKSEDEMRKYFTGLDLSRSSVANENLRNGIQRVYEGIIHLDGKMRYVVKPYIVAADGMMLFNSIGATISQRKYSINNDSAMEPTILAVQLENWFYSYKEIWRTVSKESELYRIQNVMNWYADLLREL